MGFLDHFLNAADLLLKHQRHIDAREADEREEMRASRGPRKRKVKLPKTGARRAAGAFADDSGDPDCCIAKR